MPDTVRGSAYHRLTTKTARRKESVAAGLAIGMSRREAQGAAISSSGSLRRAAKPHAA
jgi:hypothetical protein